MYWYKRVKELIKDKKGSSVIEFAMGLLLFVTFVAFVVDLLLVGGKRFNVGQEATDISRTLAKQGGVMSVTPEGYPGGDTAYLTSTEMLQKIEKRMKRSGLGEYGDGVWFVTLTEFDNEGNEIRSGRLTPNTNFKVDYMNSMDVKISASYRWRLMRFILADNAPDTPVTAERHSVSEFKYNFNDWKGERYDSDPLDEYEEPDYGDYEPGTDLDEGTGEDNGDTGGEGDADQEEDIIDDGQGDGNSGEIDFPIEEPIE